jgi:DNA/RNA-binding domain of Phe-tRNA-synthetase-like protein
MLLNYSIDESFRSLSITNSVVAEISHITIPASSQELETEKAVVAQEIMALAEQAIDENSVLAGYRDLVRSIGRSVKKFPPAAEKLLRQIKRTGRLPTVNVAVDAYNIVVARKCLALGVHDLDLVGRDIRFRLSPGGESFIPVGGGSVKATQAGDYVYADERRVLAWLDSSDSDEVKVSPATRNILIVIQGTHLTTNEYNRTALEQACRNIQRYCGGTYRISRIE